MFVVQLYWLPGLATLSVIRFVATCSILMLNEAPQTFLNGLLGLQGNYQARLDKPME